MGTIRNSRDYVTVTLGPEEILGRPYIPGEHTTPQDTLGQAIARVAWSILHQFGQKYTNEPFKCSVVGVMEGKYVVKFYRTYRKTPQAPVSDVEK